MNALKLDPDSKMVYIPKCMVVISESPFFELHKSFLGHIYKTIILKKTLNGKPGEVSVSHEDYAEFTQLLKEFGVASAQLIFDRNYKDQRRKRRLSKFSKGEALHVKETQLLEYYISLSHLLDNPPLIKSVDLVNEKQEPLLHFATQHGCFCVPDINPLTIFRKLKLVTILKIVKSIVMERQILVFSKRPQFIVQVFESLRYLLQPFVWENIYIPFLPYEIRNSVQAPGGYIIGMPSCHLQDMVETVNLQGKVVVILDDEQVIEEQEKANCILPQSLVEWLTIQLSKLELTPLHPLKSNSDSRNQRRQKKWIKTVMKVKQRFFVFLLALLNNFRPFIFEDPQDGRVDIHSKQYEAIFEKEDRPLVHQLCRTMMFLRLCEKNVEARNTIQWNQADEASLFLYCQSLIAQQMGESGHWNLLKNGSSALEKVNAYLDYVISRNERMLENRETHYNQQCLVKYIQYLEFKGIETIAKRSQAFEEPTLFQCLQQENELMFLGLRQKKNSWNNFNRRTSIMFKDKKIVNARLVFQNIASRDRNLSFEPEEVAPMIFHRKKFGPTRTYSHRVTYSDEDDNNE